MRRWCGPEVMRNPQFSLSCTGFVLAQSCFSKVRHILVLLVRRRLLRFDSKTRSEDPPASRRPARCGYGAPASPAPRQPPSPTAASNRSTAGTTGRFSAAAPRSSRRSRSFRAAVIAARCRLVRTGALRCALLLSLLVRWHQGVNDAAQKVDSINLRLYLFVRVPG